MYDSGKMLEESDSYPDDEEEVYVKRYPDKTLGVLDSFALLTNNMTGPGMMGLPLLFHEAGIIPTSLCIIYVGCCSALCGTMLAETISLVPGNSKFNRKVEYSTAFRMVIGGKWFLIAESLLLCTCFVQAIAGLVETAQSLDSFLASFVLGRTFGLQMYPYPRFLEWSSESCHEEGQDEVGVSDCTPFFNDGALVLSFGYILMTMLLLPLGRGHLKDTMMAQRLSFIALVILLLQFYYEFYQKGVFSALYHINSFRSFPVPWWGSNCAKLGGVVLFNYAYAVTVPSWLNERKDTVDVNKVIWSGVAFSSFIYITFGMLYSMHIECICRI